MTTLTNYGMKEYGYRDVFADIFGTNTEKKEQKYPPYDIIKLSIDLYEIRIALAGWDKQDIKVSTSNNVLNVEASSSQINPEPTADEFPILLKKGISKRSFVLKFKLEKNHILSGAKFENGILRLSINVEQPEEEKARYIEIK